MKRLAQCITLITLIGLVGCAGEHDGRINGKLAVSVTVEPQAWLVHRIGGGFVDVAVVVPAGQDVHSYQISDQQVTRINRSAIHFRSGTEIEQSAWFSSLTKTARVKVIDLRGGVSLRKSDHHHHDHEHGHGEHETHDPHIWLSPRRLITQAATVLKALQAEDPKQSQQYQKNHDALVAELNEADEQIRQRLAPIKGQAFFIYHPAWGYFAEDYGLKQVAIEINGKEPTDSELTALQTYARKKGVRTVFTQPQIGGRGAKAIADALGAELVALDPLASDVLANIKAAADTLARNHQPKVPDE